MHTPARRMAHMTMAAALACAAIGIGSPAWAAKDVIYPSASSPINLTASVGSHGHLQLGNVAATSPVSFNVTWSIEDGGNTGTNTQYPRTVRFTSAVNGPTSGFVSVSETCLTTSAQSTCPLTVSFYAPATPGHYLLRITADDSISGSGSHLEIQGKHLTVAFTVGASTSSAIPTKIETALTCAVLNGTTPLAATLKTDATPEVGIAGKPISFELEALAGNLQSLVGIGGAMTNTGGVATLPGVSLMGRVVGDYTFTATFAGDAQYQSSNGSGTVGIHYQSGGFLPPISNYGDSVFSNGRVIPIKVRISDANNNPVPNATLRVSLERAGVAVAPSSVSAANVDDLMRYSAADDLYIYNWDLGALANGLYAVRVELGSSSCGVLQVPITVYKRK